MLRIIIKVPGGHVQAKELNFEGNIPGTHKLVQAHFVGEDRFSEVYCPTGYLLSKLCMKHRNLQQNDLQNKVDFLSILKSGKVNSLKSWWS